MSVEEVKRFAKAVKEDESLKEELKSAGTSPDAISSFAEGKGFKFSGADVQALLDAKKGDLSEEDLEKVAGGFWVSDAVSVGMYVLAVAAAG